MSESGRIFFMASLNSLILVDRFGAGEIWSIYLEDPELEALQRIQSPLCVGRGH